ncbi:MAG: chromate transporter [Clostridia bacterium]|nr:chromate transporter [Clostridia bacterium]
MIYLSLFYEFAKIGLFAMGGGLATLPFLYNLSERIPAWFSSEQVTDMIAISESTPGPIAINMATYAGFTVAGIPGALFATLGVTAPSILIATLIARILTQFKENRLVTAAFDGIRPAAMGLIAAAGWAVFQVTLLQLPLYTQTGRLADLVYIPALLLAAALFTLSVVFKKLHPAVWLALAALVGIVFRMGGA